MNYTREYYIEKAIEYSTTTIFGFVIWKQFNKIKYDAYMNAIDEIIKEK